MLIPFDRTALAAILKAQMHILLQWVRLSMRRPSRHRPESGISVSSTILLFFFFPLYTHAPTLSIFLRRSGGWIKKNCFNSTQSLVCTGCNDACSTGEAFILVITTLDCCCPSADMVHPPPMQVKFLGTCTSPLLTRNYSRFVNVESASWFGYANAIIEVCLLNGTTKRWWCEYRTNGIRMKILTFSDCGEGTQRQLLLPHVNSHTKLAQIRTILITHLHPDRVYHDYLANIQTY